VLRLTFDRPDKRNALNAELIDSLTSAFSAVGDVRVVVLRGSGPSFTAGADIDWMRAGADLGEPENLADARRLQAMFKAIDGCPAPVVTAIQGHAIAAGVGLAACSDVVLAEPRAVFAVAEVRLGIVPAVISPYVVARIGSGAARRLFTTGERFDAETALRIGLVHEIDEDLDAAVDRVVADLLRGGPEAVRIAKQLARAPLSSVTAARAIAERRASAEGQEGLRAFLEGRRPSWLTG
jgi:methylglutaconyl-CoA hydratase